MSFGPFLLESEQTHTTDDRDLLIDALAARLRAVDDPPLPDLVADIRARIGEALGVYFSDSSSPDSFAGHIEDGESMPEGEINDFVRYSHRELYERLGGMPLGSDHLNDSEKGASAIDGRCELSGGSSPGPATLVAGSENDVSPSANEQKVPSTQGTAIPAASANEAEPMDIDCPWEPDDVPQAQETLLGKHAVCPHLRQS